MEIKIPKEVREYHETIFFGLNTRQFVCSLLAVGVAVAVYFLLQPMLDTEEIGWVCILAAAPFAVCGFFTYHGMTPSNCCGHGANQNCCAPNGWCSARIVTITPPCSPPYRQGCIKSESEGNA